MEIREYKLGNILVQYLIDENKNATMLLLPAELKAEQKKQWEKEKDAFNPRAEYMYGWEIGSMVHFQTTDYQYFNTGRTMKNPLTAQSLHFENQTVNEIGEKTEIVTTLLNEKGYKILHTLTYIKGMSAVEIETTFINESSKQCTLEMLSSFSLDNLSPFQEDDGPNVYKLHRFYGGWSLEGKHVCTPVEELALEKTWAGYICPSEKFGSLGSYPVERYFPAAVFEDSRYNVCWAVQLAINSTWQMELTRCKDTLSFSGGIGDRDFSGWKKNINQGEKFTAPKAYISVVKGDFSKACQAVTDMQKPAVNKYGEQGLPVCFNEFCATWGRPTQEKMQSFCNALKDYGVKYLVIDAGWCKEGMTQLGNGEWNIDTKIFPDMKALNQEIRNNGMIPGIWFEFEVTTKGSIMYEAEYDEMHLKRDGKVIKTADIRSYWDFRRDDVQKYLKEKVIDFIKEYNFGYLKVDYNANIGSKVDGAESGAEGLRQQMEKVREFFIKIKEEIPDLIIENCASGGHRSEASMLELSALSSFSDAHEALEIPYIAANMHYLMLPQQSLIWAVLHEEDTPKRLSYSLAATFLGRVCLSGNIDLLSEEQKKIIKQSLEFYGKLENIIKCGKTEIYGNRGRNTRYPTGTQIVLRKTEKQMFVVCHAFKEPGGEFRIDIPNGYQLKDSFFGDFIRIDGDKLIIDAMEPLSAGAVILSAERGE